jgi:CBS domain-containing protein
MATTLPSLHDLTAADLMTRNVVTIHPRLALHAAAHLLRQAGVTGVPVVDDRGRCVGMLSAVDFLGWMEERRHTEQEPIHTCPYQTEGRLPSGQQAVICTLAPGSCHLQVMQLTSKGVRTPVCLMPHDVLCDGQQVPEETCSNEVGRYMTTDFVYTGPDTKVTTLAQMMIDAHIHRIVIIDEDHRLVGIVSATDVMAVVARDACREAEDEVSG